MNMTTGRGISLFKRIFIFSLFVQQLRFILACGVGKGSYANNGNPPFSKYQQKPDADEESNVASGPFKQKIRFGSKEFKAKIIRFYGTNIVFRDDEGNGADRYMTKRCERALQRLAKYVRLKWNNQVKVRVIEAWDEDGEHAARSLHYEGRAIDITTSDRDRRKYGMLASLAYFKAEFDWVTFLDGHIHVSCKRDDAIEETNSCFPGQATVITSSGQAKRMDELNIGEEVLTESSFGDLKYSKVVMFMDAKPKVLINDFVEIETDYPHKKLQLTRRHLMIVSNDKIKYDTIFAEKVKPGHFIKVLATNGTKLIPARVKKVTSRKSNGAYAPLTEEGTVLVNGALASCYALTEDWRTAHLSFLPWRYLFRLTKFSMGYKVQAGEHWYVYILRILNRSMGILPEVYAK